MEVLLLAVMAISNIFCFMIGAKVGQTVSKGERVELPDPVREIREHKSRREFDKTMGEYETVLSNVEKYNGTSIGQRDVPRG